MWFQFQTGSIKRDDPTADVVIAGKFQFQTGSIKRVVVVDLRPTN